MKIIYRIIIIVLGLLTTKALTAQDFITLWKPSSGEITIPTLAAYTYNYNIEWFKLGDPVPLGSSSSTGDFLIASLNDNDIIEVRISGVFPAFGMLESVYTNQLRLIDVKQWGDNQWLSFSGAFYNCANLNFSAGDQPDLLQVTDMSHMLEGTTVFNTDISGWDVSTITNMNGTFSDMATFNQDIGNWDVSNVTTMQIMFTQALSFNQNLGGWDVSQVENMSSMFEGAESFNGNIGSWDVSNVTDMSLMFEGAIKFNSAIGGWDVSNVTNMEGILTEANEFNQSLEDWKLTSIAALGDITLDNSGMSCVNYSRTLHGWASDPNMPSFLGISAYGLEYSPDQITANDRNMLTSHDWSINGDIEGNCSGAVSTEFITVWSTDSSGVSQNNQISFPLVGDYYYSYARINPFNLNDTLTGFSGNGSSSDMITITFGSPGFYRITVVPIDTNVIALHRINFNNSGDKNKLLYIEQWGNYIMWSSFENAFYGCTNLDVTATDIPKLTNVTNTSYAFAETGLSTLPNFNDWDLSKVTNMSYMFKGVSGFMPDMEDWDVSNVTNMSGMFSGASDFNQDISGWDVSNVTDMSHMFNGASSFDQDLSTWDVSNVSDMSFMFSGASTLTDLGPAEGEYHTKANGVDNWDVGQVVNMEGMFSNAIQFNGDIGNWDVGQVTSMKNMFSGAAQFNADLSGWDVSKVTDMSYMFTGASSLTSIGPVEGAIHAKANGVDNWDVGQVTSMTDMFSGAISFNGDLGNWDVGQLTANGIGGSNDISFANSGMSCGNYSLTLQGWANQSNTPLNIVVDATGMEYSPDIIADRDILINDKNWTFKGDNEDSNCFLSIEEINTSSFTIYPNPTQEQFTITGLSGYETIQLVDMTGRVLQTVESQNNTSKSINVSHLANGVYNLMISTENGQRVTQKLIKQ